MRILHANRYVWPYAGAESYMFGLADLQRASGHTVEFFGVQHPRNPDHTYAKHFPTYVDLRGESSRHTARLTGVGRMLWSSSARRGMQSVVNEFRPDIVHVHGIYNELSPSVLWPIREASVPAVMTMHDYKLACPSQQLLAQGHPCTACFGGHYHHAIQKRCKNGSVGASGAVMIEAYLHRALGSYDAICTFLCPSRFLRDQMIDARVYPDRLRVVANFLDTGSWPTKVRPGGPFLYAGRLTEAKGADVLIRAAGLRPDLRVQIAGDGTERARLEELAAAVGASGVTFLGHQDRPALQELMREAVALVIPSRWHENQPMSILEAFATGVAVIGTTMGGIPEMVEDGRSGYLVPPNDPGALAQAMTAIAADGDAALRMGVAGRDVVLTRHSPQRHLDQVLGAYWQAREAP